MELKDKIALVTGASKGIGKEIAITLAKRGAAVIVNYNSDAKGAERTAEEIRKSNGEAFIVKANVAEREEVASMFREIGKKYGRVDILVNNAGITQDRTLAKMSDEEWDKVIGVNLTGAFNVAREALKLMPEGGRIINMSSIAAMTGNFGQTNYAATKAGLIGFTKSLAKEVGKRRITVNAVAPGFIKTEMTDRIPFLKRKILLSLIPLRREGTATDVADAIVFLASEKSSYITGETININGGMSL